jgi:hypothetical protein
LLALASPARYNPLDQGAYLQGIYEWGGDRNLDGSHGDIDWDSSLEDRGGLLGSDDHLDGKAMETLTRLLQESSDIERE